MSVLFRARPNECLFERRDECPGLLQQLRQLGDIGRDAPRFMVTIS
jgi:hypothetical protein